MNYYQAQNILDEVREGANYSVETINKALEMTGDLEPREFEEQRGKGVDFSLQEKGQRPGSLRSPSMVAQDVIRNSQNSWAISR